MERVEEGKHLMARGGEEQLCKGEAPANQCVIVADLRQCTIVNSAQRGTLCVKSAENEDTLSEYANQPKMVWSRERRARQDLKMTLFLEPLDKAAQTSGSLRPG